MEATGGTGKHIIIVYRMEVEVIVCCEASKTLVLCPDRVSFAVGSGNKIEATGATCIKIWLNTHGYNYYTIRDNMTGPCPTSSRSAKSKTTCQMQYIPCNVTQSVRHRQIPFLKKLDYVYYSELV